MNNTNQTQSDKTGGNFNKTVTAMFESPNFAVKELKGEAGAAFLSMPVNAEGIANIKSLKEGDKFLLKRSAKLNKQGTATYFLEILKPRSATEQIEDGI